MISDAGFDRIVTRYCGNAYASRDSTRKKGFRKVLRLQSVNEPIIVSFEELTSGDFSDVFIDEIKTKKVADNIFENLSQEVNIKNRPEADILKKAQEMFPNEDNHQKLFNLYTEATLKNKETGRSIEGIMGLNK